MLLAEQATAALRRRKARDRGADRGGLVRAARGVRGKDRGADGRADGASDPHRAAARRAGLTARLGRLRPATAAGGADAQRLAACAAFRYAVAGRRKPPYLPIEQFRSATTGPCRIDRAAVKPQARASRRKPPPRPPPKPLGPLPEWNLADLYPAMDAPEIKRDLDRAETECIAFEKAYKGRLAEHRRRSPTPAARSPRRCGATRRSRTCSAG